MQVVADQGPHVIGNPCPVVDRTTGTIWMPLTRNRGDEPESQIMKGTTTEPRTVWLTKSTDDGLTWSEPVNISDTTRKPHWRWYATGPGVGIQLKSGRMVIPCDHSDHSDPKAHPYRSHVIYSDDHGATWKLGGVIADKVNECQVVLRYTLAGPQDKNRLLFSNPASTSRVNMTVRLSYDEGKTWPVARAINPGPSAYSCLTVLPDLTIGCLYERGDRGAYERITFAPLATRAFTAIAEGKE